jgi:hypothetical protein
MVVSSILMIHAYELNHTLHFTFAVVLLGILHLICSPSCSAPMLRRSMI